MCTLYVCFFKQRLKRGKRGQKKPKKSKYTDIHFGFIYHPRFPDEPHESLTNRLNWKTGQLMLMPGVKCVAIIISFSPGHLQDWFCEKIVTVSFEIPDLADFIRHLFNFLLANVTIMLSCIVCLRKP